MNCLSMITSRNSFEKALDAETRQTFKNGSFSQNTLDLKLFYIKEVTAFTNKLEETRDFTSSRTAKFRVEMALECDL